MPEQSMADLMNGRVGDQVLVNGQKKPVLTVQPGPAGAFGCSTRRMLVPAPDVRRRTHDDHGSDGGLLAAPVQGASEILLSPAERAEVVVAFEKAGSFALRRSPTIVAGWGRDAPTTVI